MNSYTRAQQRALRGRDYPPDTRVRDRNGYVWQRGGRYRPAGVNTSWFLVNKMQARATTWRELLQNGPLELWDAESGTWSLIEPEEKGD